MSKTNDNIQQDPTEVDSRVGQFCHPPALMTEGELIQFLRIPEVSKAKDLGHVIENLRRMHGLSCIHISRQPLYPLKSVLEWIDQQVEKEKSR